MKRALALLILAACGGSSEAPDLSLPNRVSVYYHSMPRFDADLAVAFDEVRIYGERVCGSKFAGLFKLNVHFSSGPMKCGAVDAAGCYPIVWLPLVRVQYNPIVEDSAVVHEALHHVWTICRGESGADDKDVHSPEFLADVQEIRVRIAERLR